MPLYTKTGEVKYTTRRPIVYPAGRWNKDTTYIANSFSCPQVEHEGQYYVLNRLGECTGVNPKDSSAANDGIWILMDKMQYLFTEVLMAEFAKLASAIYWGDYTFSQYGKDASGSSTTDYGKFDPSKIGQADCPFTPNLMIDWLLGKLVANDVFLKGVIEAVSGKIGDFDIDGGTLENKNKSLAARIISEYIYGSYNLKAVLGSGLPVSSGDTPAMYAHSTGKHYGRNIALMLKATGSTWRHDVTGGYANFALHGEGGALFTPAPGDHWEMPGILYGCEVHTAKDKSASMSKQWGNGVGVVAFSYNVSLREYYFEIEQGKVNDNLYAFPVAGHIRESGDVGSAHGTCVRNGNRYTVIFWSGGNKVYPQTFQFAIFGRNQ